MTETLLAILLAGIQLWTKREDNVPYKDKKKYADEILSLKEDWYEEYNKPIKERSDATLDRITFRLRILGDRFAAAVKSSEPANKS